MDNTIKKAGSGRFSKVRVAAWSVAGLLLLTPAVAMLFTDAVDWSLSDFVFMGVLMLSVGIPFELTVRRSGNAAYRAGVGVTLAGAFLMVWLNGAVGIIGSENDDVNAVYLVLLMGLFTGAVVSRFRPHGLMRTTAATAAGIVVITAVALLAGWGAPESGPRQIIGVNALFFAIFGGAAALFREALPDGDPPDPAV